MICPKCSGSMNPINLEQSIFECIKCSYRQHKYLSDLDVSIIRADLDQTAANELPIQAQEVFNDV